MASRPVRQWLAGILLWPLGLVTLYDRLVSVLRPGWNGRVRGRCVEDGLAVTMAASHGGVDMRFHCPNPLTVFRAQSFSTKEPETLEWIDGFEAPAVFWDIGANVGLYSIYAAKRHPGLKVYAFEPSVLNLELLARNIALNGVEDRVCIVPLALFGMTGEEAFRIGNMDRGGALSAFGVDFGYDGETFAEKLRYRTMGCSADDLVAHLGVPVPDRVKIDVDGVEHIILAGGRAVFADRRVRSMLIEVNDDFADQRRQIDASMAASGFTLSSKRHGQMMDGGAFANIFNNIWHRTG